MSWGNSSRNRTKNKSNWSNNWDNSNNNGNNNNGNNDNWGNNNNWGNKNGKNNKNNQFCLLVGNYPPLISADAIVNEIKDQIKRFTGNDTIIQNCEVLKSIEFLLYLSNRNQAEAILKLNGSYIYNNPIWIVKFPTNHQKYIFDLSEIFSMTTCNGHVELSNLKQKFERLGKDSSDINFNNRDFVEFLFYRLGSESRDRRFFIDTLNLSDNLIEDVNSWSPFLVFLPTVRTIILNNNHLKERPNFPAFPFISFKFDSTVPIGKNKKKGNQNDGNSNQSNWGSSQDNWNSYQNDWENGQNDWN
ncbi:hypothetical protein M9Y10_022423 [Tritrichomonas musculus]|uniref:RRM domain-containing protein n=1 Tax=Tritrichomonas musculus TaxID=1915356 RepID=A0ABR2KS83_9EUKA